MPVRWMVLMVVFVVCSCKKPTEPPPPPLASSIELVAEDASCTETWLRVKLTGVVPPQTAQIWRDGQMLLTLELQTPDSLLIDEGLLPNRPYTYKAYRLSDSQLIDSSTAVTLTTMDTTSHNWVFDPPVLLGDGSSSVLYDVAIINDTLAYAVGEIYKRDSLGNWDPNAYNLAKWNGNTWQLIRIQFYTFCGQSGTGSYPAKSVFAFSPTDVWIGMDGSQVVHWNGQNQSAPQCTPVSINKLWGNSSTGELYVVGNGGGIAILSSIGTWRRVESGTTIPLNDVWGGANRIAGENIVLVAGGDKFTIGEKKLLRLHQNGELDSITWGTIYRRVQSVWFDQHAVCAGGDGLFRLADTGAWREIPVPNIFLDRIRGTAANDVCIVGDFGLLLHYNGFSVREYPAVALSPGVYKSIAITTRLVVAVGWAGSRAVALVGRR